MATYILDGYNVARAMLSADDLRGDLEAVRGTLEAKLARFLQGAGRRARIVLVYDGASGQSGHASSCEGLEVVFARPPRRADDLILDLCRRREGEGDLHVVTSDLADIGNRIQALRLRHWTSADFAALVRDRARTASGHIAGGRAGRGEGPEGTGTEKPTQVSAADTEGWLHEFGLQTFPDETRREEEKVLPEKNPPDTSFPRGGREAEP